MPGPTAPGDRSAQKYRERVEMRAKFEAFWRDLQSGRRRRGGSEYSANNGS